MIYVKYTPIYHHRTHHFIDDKLDEFPFSSTVPG